MRVGSSNPASTSSKSPRKGISPTSIRYLALGDCGILLANLAAALFCIGPRRERCTVIDAVDHHNKWVVAEAGVAVVERFRGDVRPVPFFQRLIDQTAANRERLFQCVINPVLAALVGILVMEVVIDHHLVA